MKHFTRALTIAAILAAPVFAQDAPQADNPMKMQGQGMPAMHEHMQEMQGLMKQLKKEQDPQKRQQLMQEHMNAMQSGMQMMRGRMEDMEDMEDMSKGSKTMEECNAMMNQRMDMMQMMMDQMNEHQMESKKAKGRGHM